MRNDSVDQASTEPGPGDRRGLALALACVAVGGLGLWAHARSFLPFFADDSFISLQYSRRLLEGAGLTFADGEWVEGYSNLLWVLLVALGGLSGLDLVVTARLFGFLGMFLALSVIAIRHWDDEVLPTLGIAGFLAASGSMAIWAIGGLEQGLLAALLAIAFASAWRLLRDEPTLQQVAIPGLALAGLCVTRPDGPLFAAALGLGILAARRDLTALKTVAKLAVLPLAFVAAQLVFRVTYYGDWVPNTAHVKLGLGVEEGLAWMTAGLWQHCALVAAAVVGLGACFDPAARKRLILVAPALLGWIAYVVAIGGDIFPGRRHLVPVVVLLAFPLGEGLRWAVKRNRIVAWIGAVVLLGGHAWMQHNDPENRRANRERWEWDCAVSGTLLAEAFGDADPLLAAGAAGCMPYFSGLNTIDLWGLNDRYLATHPVKRQKNRLGHRMGDLTYVVDRQPDLLQFGGVKGDKALKSSMGRRFAADPRFVERYRVVTFEGRKPHKFRANLWVRIEGPIGIERTEGRIEIPAFLLSERKYTVARLDKQGRLGIDVSPGKPAQIKGLRLDPTTTWNIQIDATGGPVSARLGADGLLAVKSPERKAFVRTVVLTEVGSE